MKYLFIFVLLILSFNSFAFHQEEIDILKNLCKTELIKEKEQFYCPICPDFTDFAGESYDRFTITQTITGNFLPDQKAIFVGYFGCEPRVRKYGGYLLLTTDPNGNQKILLDEDREYLGICRMIKKPKQDFLKCIGGDKFQGRPPSWKVVCRFKKGGKLSCSKIK